MKTTKIIVIIVSVIIFACTPKTITFKGDLYFKLINLSRNKGLTKVEEQKFVRLIDSLLENKSIPKNELILLNHLKKLKELNLLTKPNIQLKNNEKYKTIYLTLDEYKKVSNYNLNDLQKRKKKVEILLNIKELDSGIYFSDKIVRIKEIDGKTPWNK